MTSTDRILDVIDRGLQATTEPDVGWESADNGLCARCQRTEPTEGSDWCTPCRAYLLGDAPPPETLRPMDFRDLTSAFTWFQPPADAPRWAPGRMGIPPLPGDGFPASVVGRYEFTGPVCDCPLCRGRHSLGCRMAPALVVSPDLASQIADVMIGQINSNRVWLGDSLTTTWGRVLEGMFDLTLALDGFAQAFSSPPTEWFPVRLDRSEQRVVTTDRPVPYVEGPASLTAVDRRRTPGDGTEAPASLPLVPRAVEAVRLGSDPGRCPVHGPTPGGLCRRCR